jgi:hypothetical protein
MSAFGGKADMTTTGSELKNRCDGNGRRVYGTNALKGTLADPFQRVLLVKDMSCTSVSDVHN